VKSQDRSNTIAETNYWEQRKDWDKDGE